MAYKLIKRVITRGGYDKADIMDKLDAYLAFGRITAEEYRELMAMVAPEPEIAEPETTEPVAAEPVAAEPETAEPETAEPEAAEPETAEPETTQESGDEA